MTPHLLLAGPSHGRRGRERVRRGTSPRRRQERHNQDPWRARCQKELLITRDVVLCPFTELSLHSRSQYSKERVTPWTNQIIDECLKDACPRKSYFRDLATPSYEFVFAGACKAEQAFQVRPMAAEGSFLLRLPESCSVAVFCAGCYLHHHAKERCATSHQHCFALGHEDGWNFVRTSGNGHDGLLAGFLRK